MLLQAESGDPLSDTDLAIKLREYFFFANGKEQSKNLIQGIWNLEDHKDPNW